MNCRFGPCTTTSPTATAPCLKPRLLDRSCTGIASPTAAPPPRGHFRSAESIGRRPRRFQDGGRLLGSDPRRAPRRRVHLRILLRHGVRGPFQRFGHLHRRRSLAEVHRRRKHLQLGGGVQRACRPPQALGGPPTPTTSSTATMAGSTCLGTVAARGSNATALLWGNSTPWKSTKPTRLPHRRRTARQRHLGGRPHPPRISRRGIRRATTDSPPSAGATACKLKWIAAATRWSTRATSLGGMPHRPHHGGAYLPAPSHALGETHSVELANPIVLSKHQQDVFYMTSNKVHRSLDRGDTFETRSDDLTRVDSPETCPLGP